MQPIRPVVDGLELYEYTIGVPDNNQPEYIPLPTLRAPDGRVLCRWTLDAGERKAVVEGGDICLVLFCHNHQIPGISMYVNSTLPEHTAEYIKDSFMLGDEMEISLLREGIERAKEQVAQAQEAFDKKAKEIAARIQKA